MMIWRKKCKHCKFFWVAQVVQVVQVVQVPLCSRWVSCSCWPSWSRWSRLSRLSRLSRWSVLMICIQKICRLHGLHHQIIEISWDVKPAPGFVIVFIHRTKYSKSKCQSFGWWIEISLQSGVYYATIQDSPSASGSCCNPLFFCSSVAHHLTYKQGVVQKLRKYFSGSRETPPPACNRVISWTYPHGHGLTV